ncbi:thiamine pyrophosphate-dependent dehydrogenase E1 component subunit alpha [Paenibacillus koleovorans]|uniref:thiamine pyrophosphate-dependent dehydrogenase E1 component subunit alpha n=1 Tax=Paenibacillus koleovorans TaxID=121608 RepID=UPI000FDBE7B6|nr:thiamine pyrophosphate-dependent dehydrogenase E1 component subunit alpha [Paenibacillus koleovorans]
MAMGDKLQRFYRGMRTIRRFEEMAIELYKEGLIGGSYHSYIGQEAVAVGVCSALRNDDYITTTYRGRGQHLAKGADPYKLFAELLGRVDGYCKGKGGPMHITDVQTGILGANGIVGAGVPISVGAALSAQMSGIDRVSVAFFGDGAINQGAVSEALNLAAVWCLPVILVCENNLYSEMTPFHRSVKNKDLVERAAGFCMPGIIVDGNDVEAVFETTSAAVERARRGEGPTMIEAKTYRLQGHMFGDSEMYRSKEEVAAWRGKDPLDRLKRKLLEQGLATESLLAEWDRELTSKLEQAVASARLSPEPGPEAIYADVY